MTTSHPLASIAEGTDVHPIGRVPSWAWLALGFVGTLATGPRYGIAALAWVTPVPYLLYARSARGWRAWLALAGTLLAAYSAQLLQICTAPLPPYAALMFGLPTGFLAFLAFYGSEQVRRRIGDAFGIYVYAAAVVVSGWIGYGVLELGQWVTIANTQVHSNALMQLTSLFGIAGIDFLMSWFAAVVAAMAAAMAAAATRPWRHAVAVTLAIVGALAYGSIRLDAVHARTVEVATVVTDVGLTPTGVPDAATLAANEQTLFDRTDRAAALGARLVVWNEVAQMVEPADEARLIERGRAAARRLGIDLVLGYGVLDSRSPLRFQNKYAFITDEGVVAQIYNKHHPVPGEPSTRGTEPIAVIERPYGRVTGAICYDYDFPSLGLAHARAGAELVFVPSSDWRGIDPVHTWMARVRGIEGGYSVVRATRWGASAAFDAYGHVRGWQQTTENNDRVMLASVPIGRVATLRTAIGNAPLIAAGAVLVMAAALAFGRRRRG